MAAFEVESVCGKCGEIIHGDSIESAGAARVNLNRNKSKHIKEHQRNQQRQKEKAADARQASAEAKAEAKRQKQEDAHWRKVNKLARKRRAEEEAAEKERLQADIKKAGGIDAYNKNRAEEFVAKRLCPVAIKYRPGVLRDELPFGINWLCGAKAKRNSNLCGVHGPKFEYKSDQPRCEGRTNMGRGRQCRKPAIEGERFCKIHESDESDPPMGCLDFIFPPVRKWPIVILLTFIKKWWNDESSSDS